MKNKKLNPQNLTPKQLAEEKDLMQFCHDAALRVFQMLDREEAEAGLPDLYSHRLPRQRGRKKNSMSSVPSVVKKRGMKK